MLVGKSQVVQQKYVNQKLIFPKFRLALHLLAQLEISIFDQGWLKKIRFYILFITYLLKSKYADMYA